MDHPITNEDHQSGYFEKGIKKYLIEHHPDLIQGEGAQIHLMELTDDALTLFQAYDRAGMLPYEAMERALTETLEGISSPYSILRDFLVENETFLNYTTGIENLGEQALVLKLLAENVEHIYTTQLAVTPEEIMNQANKELMLGVRKTLIALTKN